MFTLLIIPSTNTIKHINIVIHFFFSVDIINANVKIYLTASSKVRAKRRFDELTAKGEDCNFDDFEKDIIDRDYRDMHRETSPLKQADDAILLDTSDRDIDQVVSRMKQIIETTDK